MAITQLQGPQSLAALTGSSLGSGLGTGLQNLAQSKLEQLQQKQFATGLSTLQNPNTSRQQKLQAIASFPLELQKIILSNPALDQYLNESQYNQQQMQSQEQQFVGQGGPMQGLMNMPMGDSPASAMMNTQFQQVPQQQMQPQQGAQQRPISKLFESPAQRAQAIQERRAVTGENKLAYQEKKDIHQRFAPKAEEIIKHAERLQNHKLVYQSLNELNKSPNIAGPGKARFAEWLENISGIPQNIILSTEDQAWGKFIPQFIPGMKDIIGARMPVAEFQELMKGYPQLQNTKEGRQLLINLGEISADYAENERNAVNNILEKHGGYFPANADDLYHKKTEKFRKKYGDEMIKILKTGGIMNPENPVVAEDPLSYPWAYPENAKLYDDGKLFAVLKDRKWKEVG